MAQWALTDIENKVRALLGFTYSSSLESSIVIGKINQYYQFQFPVEVKPQELKTWWDISTVIGEETVNVPTLSAAVSYSALIGPCYYKGNEIQFYTDPQQFFALYPQSIDPYDNGDVIAVLLYNNQLLLRSPPDAVETLRIGAILRPSALEDPEDEPLKNEWGQLIAYGTAEQMAYEFADTDRLQIIQAGKRDALSMVEDTTYTQLSYRPILAKGF